ncbi:MAG: dipeptidase PepV [Bacilli bacterium]|nr:dipeptidase PepV [Bacilli bacterium]
MENLFEKYQKEYLKDLFDLLRINSVRVEQPEVKDAPFGYGCVEALKYVLELGKKMGFKVKNIDNVAGHIEFGEGKEILGILCHLDVVPVGEGWTNPPFEPIIKDNKIYARGSNDDKGPLMSALHAMKILKDQGFKPNKRIRLIVGTDEETESRGLKRYLQVEEQPTLGFSPDADFPLIYGEKGIMSIDIYDRNKSKDIKNIKSGDVYNVVPDKAYACLKKDLSKEFDKYLKDNKFDGCASSDKLYVEGVRAHGMEPRNGKNAMLRLFNFLSNNIDSNLIKFVSKYLNDSRFNDIGLSYTHHEMGDLTCNVAVCDIDENGGKVGLNLRYPIEWKKEEFLKGLEEKAKEYNLEAVVISDSNPHYINPKSELVTKLHEAYVEVTNDTENKIITIGGGTYARLLKNAVAFGAALPGRETVAHMVDEYMSIEDLKIACLVYIKSIEKLG